MKQIWLVRLLYFLVFCCTASWLPILADFCKHKGFNGAQTATILSITPILMLLVQPIYGALADRLGIKKVLLCSFAGAATSFTGFLYVTGFASIILVTLSMSFFYNGLQPLLDSISLKLSTIHPKFSYGTLRAFGALGWSVTGLIIGNIIDQIHIESIFYVSAISLMIGLIFTLFLSKDITSTSIEIITFGGFRSILSSNLFLVLFTVFIISVAGTTIWNFYSMYLKDNGASAQLVGLGLSFQGLCEIPFFYFSALIIRRFSLGKILLVTAMATMLRLILYSLVRIPVAAIPIELLHGISWSLFWVVCVEIINKLVKQEWIATGQSLLYASYFGIGQVIGNYWTGWLYDSSIGLPKIFLLNAGIMLVSIPLIIRINRKMKHLSTI